MGGSNRGGDGCPTSSPHFPAVKTLKPYLALSGHPRMTTAAVADLAEWYGLEPWPTRPLPADRTGVVVTSSGPWLHVPGLPPTAWHPGLTPWRLSRGGEDPLVRATAAGPGRRIVDATLGLGHDALVLRAAGASVLGVECRPALALLTFFGHAAKAVGPALALRLGDFRAVLGLLPTGSADVVYFDPMFPVESTGPNPTWAPVRAAACHDRLDEAGFAAARRVATERIVLKLAPGAAPSALGGVVPSVVQSKRARFAVYAAREST